FIVAPVHLKGEIEGFILLQINMVKLFKDTFNNFLKYSNITVSNGSNVGGSFEIYNKPFSVHPAKLIHTALNYQFAGESWHFNATSSPYFMHEEYSWEVWFSLTTTLFFCVLMNIILFILYGQRHLIQYLAEARELQLQTEKAKNKLLLNATGEGVLWIDLECRIAFINNAAEKLLEYDSDELKDEPIYTILLDKIHEDFSSAIESLAVYRAIHEKSVVRIKEAVFWKKDRNYFWVEYTCIPIIIDNEVKGAAIIFSDITERLDNENKLINMAHIDNLTKLPNRLSFFEFLEHTIARAQRNKSQFGVCFIDVDNFKYINDTFGHIYGDKLLTILPGKIKPYLREADYFARIGGDEFGLVFEEIYQVDDLSKIITRILAAFDKPIKIDDQYVNASLSIGIAIYPENGADSETLLKNADNAMYQSKAKGKSTFSFYNKRSNEKVIKYDNIESALHRAINEKAYRICYQPLIHTITHKILGVEALLRWEDEELKNLPLIESLLIAEDRGLMYELGECIMQQAFAEFQDISRTRANFCLAMNISIKQIEDVRFMGLIKTLLCKAQIKPNQICFEIKETSLIKNTEHIINDMMDLCALGVQFALDDFGIGYSSIHLLKKLPISFLKIDHSFIKDLEKNADDTTIVFTTIQLTHGLGIKSIAEGVEAKEQLELLKKWGCTMAQGFYFAKPMPLNELLLWMKTHDEGLKNKGK
ncbi:bifunctional diguanylate cyclase/phosphodiesterase, partial [uncultured Legionella sp.]|uniref:putative bifunctional diguanylate cyclase/phosphodiesterase n=1 Tax=uncultured Legionella sp. TaxID=210934 RepID=UPI002618FE8D